MERVGKLFLSEEWLMNILVVDDEDMIRENLVAFIEDEGFDVVGAASAEEALDMLQTKKIDMSIVDMRLPGIDGNAFILKAHEIDQSIGFIIHTGSTDYILPSSLKAIGITEKSIFKKPIQDMNMLLDALKSRT